jgi:hypothetical protein
MNSQILKFVNNNGKTIYNPTAPFIFEGKKYMGVRVESLDSELDSEIFFAYEKNKKTAEWEIDYSIKSLNLQDPSYVKLDDFVVLSGIEVFEQEKGLSWKQRFYKGESIRNLEFLASGPNYMKDIRLVQLDNKIGVFTRPQGGGWGCGKIGYLEIDDVDDLKNFSDDDWYSARIIDGLFTDDSWGGVNQAIKISKDKIKVLGHVANKTLNSNNELEKHYFGMSFIFNPSTFVASEYEIIAKRDDFPLSPAKRSPELNNVVFIAGVYADDILSTQELYAGLSDFCIGSKKFDFNKS